MLFSKLFSASSSEPKKNKLTKADIKVKLSECDNHVFILNHTINPYAYFYSLEKIENILTELSEYENKHIFTGSIPSIDLWKLHNQLQESESQLIMRMANSEHYIENTKLFYKDLYKYRNKFIPEVIDPAIKEMNETLAIYKGEWLRDWRLEPYLDLPPDVDEHTKTYKLKQSQIQKTTPDVMQEFKPYFNYQLNCNIIKTEKIAFVMLNRNNQYEALVDIDKINSLLTIAKKACSNLPDNIEICTEDINFLYPDRLLFDSTPYTYLEYTPFTKTFKFAKFPMHLHFSYSNDLYDCNTIFDDFACGTISYLKNGYIGKASVTRFIRKMAYTFKIEGNERGLTVLNITRSSTDELHRNEKILFQKQ